MTLLCQLLPLCCKLLRKVSTWFICSIVEVLGFGWLVGFFVCVCLFLKYLFFFKYIYIQNKAGNGCLKPAPPWKEDRIRTGRDTHTPERRAETFGIKSLENHVTNMTFLESK